MDSNHMHLTISGVPISIKNKSQLCRLIWDHMDAGLQMVPVVTFNITMFGLHSKSLLMWLKQQGIFTPDGIGISILLYLRYRQWVPRYAGIDMVSDVLAQTNQSYRVALIGASSEALAGASKWVQSKGHSVVFLKDGYTQMTPEDFSQLQQVNPHLILVATGCPSQDQLIYDIASHGVTSVCIGVGGAFDVWSGTKTRAPKIMCKWGLEWLYRCVQEPFRVARIWRAICALLFNMLFVKE